MTFKLTAVMTAAVCAMALTSPASALDRKVKIVNKTGYTIVEFYGSNTGTNSWEEDILGEDILVSGDYVTINFDDATGYCKYDFKAIFDDGDELVRQGINVCEVGTFTYE